MKQAYGPKQSSRKKRKPIAYPFVEFDSMVGPFAIPTTCFDLDMAAHDPNRSTSLSPQLQPWPMFTVLKFGSDEID